jgi:broad specificity phosphatase PhoE
MRKPKESELPHSTLNWLAQVPMDRPVTVLLRHSARGPLPVDEDGSTVPLTESGIELARELGKRLRGRLCSLHTSPVLRCCQTATALMEGVGQSLPIISDQCLGAPGVYVLDETKAWTNWLERGHEGVMSHLVSGDGALPGMAEPEAAARSLVKHMLGLARRPGIHLFVTHDSLVAATAARLLGEKLTPADWPEYLEGAFFWKEQDFVRAAYRDWYK